jgi:predicted nuclease with TOPRIM domain
MSVPFDLNGGLKLCEEQGRTVGVFVADQTFQKLTAENERLKAEMARLQTTVAERENRIESLYVLLEEVAGFRPEELADLEKNGASLDGVIEELDNLNPTRRVKAPL